MDSASQSARGKTIEIIGDELLCILPSPQLAVEAAIDMMRRIDREPLAGGRRLALRIGVHHGHILMKDLGKLRDRPTVSGDTVNTASRITGLAKAGQILISAACRQQLPPHLQRETRGLKFFSLKGKSEDMEIFEVFWQAQEDLTTRSSVKEARTQVTRLKLRHRQRELLLDESRTQVTIGRELTHDIVISDGHVSRFHAVINRHSDKFMLTDKSTNGTYVSFDGGKTIRVHMEEVMLYGNGRISVGHDWQNTTPEHCLDFEVLTPDIFQFPR
jgi:hypothetical protein